MQDIIKTNELQYKSKRKKVYNISEYYLPIVFLRDIHEGYLSLEDADDEQCNLVAKLNNLDKGTRELKK